jgi:hypothetical protein
MTWEETFPPGTPTRSRCFELVLDSRDSYFRRRVFLFSSVSTNCTGISADFIPKRPIRTLTYPGSPAVPIHKHLFRATDLLTHGIVDCVTGALLGAADLAVCLCTATLGTSYYFRAGQVEGRLVEPKRADPSARFGGSQRFGYHGNSPLANALYWNVVRCSVSSRGVWLARR